MLQNVSSMAGDRLSARFEILVIPRRRNTEVSRNKLLSTITLCALAHLTDTLLMGVLMFQSRQQSNSAATRLPFNFYQSTVFLWFVCVSRTEGTGVIEGNDK